MAQPICRRKTPYSFHTGRDSSVRLDTQPPGGGSQNLRQFVFGLGTRLIVLILYARRMAASHSLPSSSTTEGYQLDRCNRVNGGSNNDALDDNSRIFPGRSNIGRRSRLPIFLLGPRPGFVLAIVPARTGATGSTERTAGFARHRFVKQRRSKNNHPATNNTVRRAAVLVSSRSSLSAGRAQSSARAESLVFPTHCAPRYPAVSILKHRIRLDQSRKGAL